MGPRQESPPPQLKGLPRSPVASLVGARPRSGRSWKPHLTYRNSTTEMGWLSLGGLLAWLLSFGAVMLVGRRASIGFVLGAVLLATGFAMDRRHQLRHPGVTGEFALWVGFAVLALLAWLEA